MCILLHHEALNTWEGCYCSQGGHRKLVTQAPSHLLKEAGVTLLFSEELRRSVT